MSDDRNNKNQSDLSSWIFPVIMLMCFPPLGVLLVVLKVLDGSKRAAARSRHPYYTQQDAQGGLGARTTAGTKAGSAAPRTETAKSRRKKTGGDRIAALASKGKKLTVIGSVIAAVFAFATVMTATEYLGVLPGDVAWFLQEVIPTVCFTAAGLGCLWAGVRKRKQAQRYRNYLAMIGRRQSVSVSSLASATGLSPAKVREDLEDMLGEGLFPAGFLDYGGDMLVLSADGLRDESPKTEAPAQPKAEQDRENAILSEIREVNDAIANEKLSAQIDRIGVITAKILDYQKSHPEKSPQLHSFLSYYLPTTLKILRAYGQLESQEVSGENITAAMARIEGMMDKVVEGFEKQLDQLFQGDAMDITTDVEVLERMLAKDGLSSGQGMTLGL